MFRILIIDDEPDLRMTLGAIVEDYGYNVIEGTDGSEVLKLAIRFEPDVFILDVNKPVMDGMTAIKILKSDIRTFRIPVGIRSTVKDPDRERYASELDAAEFFGRPWSGSHLIRKLAELTEGLGNEPGGPMSVDAYSRIEPATASAKLLMTDRLETPSGMNQARLNTGLS